MEFKHYQLEAAKTAVYPAHSALEYLTTGYVAEAGEFAGKIAKVFRTDKPLDRDACLAELGDGLWFISELCRFFGATLDEVAMGNLEKLKGRQIRGTLKGDGDVR